MWLYVVDPTKRSARKKVSWAGNELTNQAFMPDVPQHWGAEAAGAVEE
jgi:hypothetical protein